MSDSSPGFVVPLGEAVVNIRGVLDALHKDLNQAKRETDSAMKRIGELATKAGRQLTKYVTLPVLGIGTASVKVAVDFDRSMRKITALVGVSASQVAAWRKEVLAMAPATGRGPGELADALFFVASAGIKTAEGQ